MIVLDTIPLEGVRLGYGELHAHDRRKEGKPDGCRGRGRRAFVARYVPVMIAERESALPWHHRLPQPSHDREQGSRRNAGGFLQPYWADSGRMLAPTTARCHGGMVCLIRLEPLGICPPLWPHRRGQDGPPPRVLGAGQGLRMYGQALAALALGGLGLRRTASAQPLCGGGDGFDTIMACMRAPEARRATPPSRPPACLVRAGRLGVGRPGQPAGCHALEGLGAAVGLLRVRGRGGAGRLLRQLAGVYDEKPDRFHSQAPVSVCHCHRAGDTVPVPTSGRLLACPAWLGEP